MLLDIGCPIPFVTGERPALWTGRSSALGRLWRPAPGSAPAKPRWVRSGFGTPPSWLGIHSRRRRRYQYRSPGSFMVTGSMWFRSPGDVNELRAASPSAARYSQGQKASAGPDLPGTGVTGCGRHHLGGWHRAGSPTRSSWSSRRSAPCGAATTPTRSIVTWSWSRRCSGAARTLSCVVKCSAARSRCRHELEAAQLEAAGDRRGCPAEGGRGHGGCGGGAGLGASGGGADRRRGGARRALRCARRRAVGQAAGQRPRHG